MPTLHAQLGLLADSSDHWTEAWRLFDEANPNVVQKVLNRTSPKPDWRIKEAIRPPGKALPLAQRDRLRLLAAATDDAERPRTLLALEPNGSVSVSDAFT